MRDFEKLGLFYLGRQHDLATGKRSEEPILYDSRDLVTHAVCVGMTGSGKTGLCLGLIEEAALDGVPVLAIDPKGDISNLLLTFPRLAPEDFRPWIDEEDARRQSKTPDEFAAEEAQRWKAGLADWGQDGARIDRLRRAAEFAIYTPGSGAGLPVSILGSFAPPKRGADDAEVLAERAAATATSVLSLAGLDAPPRSREHTLLSSVFTSAWREGRGLDLTGLIQQVQSPPFQKVGVVDLESFFPSKERFDLAMRLNGLLAAPGFEQWLHGEALDPASLLYTADGQPRVAIFSIAHLGDAERMFFVSLLLNEVVAWMRTQTGTSSLRAIVYMDEIAGYFPPVANPPSKGPLLVLLKQGRAFGLGVLLATQNPVDLDYKGLANTGTWFLGRLQTERDKLRVLDGLEGAAAGTLDRADADRTLSALGKRVFLLHDVHEKAPVVFQTRWTMSYLRGPLSRDQIRALTSAPSARDRKSAGATQPAAQGASAAPPGIARPARGSSDPPLVPPGVDQFFLPASHEAGRSDAIAYAPAVIGAARVAFGDPKLGINETRDVVYAAPVSDGAVAVDWNAASLLDLTPDDLHRAPAGAATFAPVPSAALQARNYAAWQKDFGRWLGQAQKLELLRHRELKLISRPGESERDFRIRAQDAQRAARDEAVEQVRKKFAPKQAQLAERLRRAQSAVTREQEQASHQKLQTMVSMGATVLGALIGRKTIGTSTLGRATTAARGVGRSMKEVEDVKRASDTVAAVTAQIADLDKEVQEETQRIASAFQSDAPLERVALAPKRGQITVQFVALGWVPGDAPGSTT